MHFKWLTLKGDERERYEYYRTSHIILTCVVILLFIVLCLMNYGVMTIQAEDIIHYTILFIIIIRLFIDPSDKSDHAFMEKRLRKLGSIEEMRRRNDSPATFITLGVVLLILSILARERLPLVGLIVLTFGGLMWYYYRLNRYEKKIIDMIEEEEMENARNTGTEGGNHVDV